MIIHCTDVEIYVRMSLCKGLYAFRSCDDAEEVNLRASVLLQLGYRINRRAARCQHGIYDENLTIRTVCRKLAIILYRLQGLRITIHADVSNLCCRNHLQHPIYHAKACAKDRNNRQLLTLQLLGRAVCYRGIDFHILQLQVASCLIADQHCNLAYGLTKCLGSCCSSADKSDLVLNQRVIHYYYFCHFSPRFCALARLMQPQSGMSMLCFYCFSSYSAIFAMRLACRSSPEKAVERNVSTTSMATFSPMTPAPIASTLASL